MRQDSIIRKIADVMRKMFPEATTLLFGSQARGTAYPVARHRSGKSVCHSQIGDCRPAL